MALTKCEECKKEVSSKAKECPHCGAPVESKGTGLSLGQFLVLVIAVMVFIGWIGDKFSGSSTGNTSSMPQKVEVATSDKEKEAQKDIKTKNPVPQLSKLTNKSQEEVEQILGVPDSTSEGTLQGYDVIRNEYLVGKLEITYIEGGARYITLNLEECSKEEQLSENMTRCLEYEDYYKDYVFSNAGARILLSEVGIDTKDEPDFSSQSIKQWKNLHGNYEVGLYEDGKGGIKYIMIITDIKYQ